MADLRQIARLCCWWLQAHAWLMVIGWGFLIPSGVVIARSFKNLGPIWFQIHRAVQTLGLACALSGKAPPAMPRWQSTASRRLCVPCSLAWQCGLLWEFQ